MENPFRPSIRKQFLDKIYQRNLQNQLKEAEEAKTPEKPGEVEEKDDKSEDFGIREDKRSWTELKRAATPGVGNKWRSESFGTDNFANFLNEILRAKGKVTKDVEKNVLSVSKALTEQFTKNPQFSLEFYIAMTGVLNYIKDKEHFNCEYLIEKTKAALRHLQVENVSEVVEKVDFDKNGSEKTGSYKKIRNTLNIGRSESNQRSENNAKNESYEKNNLKQATEKVNLKVINTLKRVLSNNEDLLNVFSSFLILFTEVDKDLEKVPLKRLQPSKIIELSQKYLQTPGKMIQLCRKFPDFIESHQISDPYLQLSEDFLTSASQSNLISLDRTGGIIIFYNFLQSCHSFANNYTIPMPNIPLMSSPSQETIAKSSVFNMNLSQFEEDIEASKDSLKQSSRTLTPIKNLQNSTLANHFQSKFQQFLKDNQELMLDSLENRILLYDQFERSILSEIRDRFVPRIANLERFEEELSNL